MRRLLRCSVLTLIPIVGAATPGEYATAHLRIYESGYTIAEFIVARWGEAKLRELVLRNGDTAAPVGFSLPEFETQWLSFVREAYGMPLRPTGSPPTP